MKIELFIFNKDCNKSFEVSQVCQGQIVLTSQLNSAPDKLEFNIARDLIQDIKFQFFEGDMVQLFIDDVGIFKGYIFDKSRNKEQIISVTAYDQRRYLTNKDSYIYYYKKASDIVKMIASDFKLKIGQIEDSKYIIEQRIEDNQSLWDIIINAINITKANTNQRFILIDDFGKLCLKNAKNLIIPYIMISDEADIIDFNFKTDIGSDTYNKIKLAKVERKIGITEIVVEQNQESINNWGTLQYFEKITDEINSAQMRERAKKYLEAKNRKSKILEIECFGNINVSAGKSIYINIKDVGEVINLLGLVEKCTHYISESEHIMKIKIAGDYL